jgi:hypothetical protein
MQTQKIHLGDALTIVTGKFLSPNGMRSLQDTLRYLTGDVVFINQIPRAVDACRPHILASFPELGNPPDDVRSDEGKKWISEHYALYGDEIEISPLPTGAFKHGNAAAELAEQIGADRVFVTVPN